MDLRQAKKKSSHYKNSVTANDYNFLLQQLYHKDLPFIFADSTFNMEINDVISPRLAAVSMLLSSAVVKVGSTFDVSVTSVQKPHDALTG